MARSRSRTTVGGRSEWNPLDLRGALGCWFKARNIVGLADGTAITIWPDFAPANRDAAQGTAGFRPLFKLISGVALARFDGTDDFMATTLASIQPLTIFAVANVTASGANKAIVGGNSTTPNDGALFLNASNQANVFGGSSLANPAAGITGALHVYEGIINGTSSLIGIDGGPFTIGDAGSGTGMGLGIALGRNGVANFCPMDLAEVVICYGALDRAARVNVRMYLGQQYSINVNLQNLI